MIPMELLAVGESARILQIDGQHELVTRLAEMGLRRGTPVRMVQPGCPCIVAVNNHRVSFRGEDAAVVLVEPLP